MSSDAAGGSWVAVSTHHFKETVAVVNLERQGFVAYCPMIRKRTRHARRLREVLRPLFPGYVFIRLDLHRDQWRPVLSTVGVRRLIRFGDRLGVLPEAFVEGLLEREEDGAVPMPRYQEAYHPGEKLRFRDGPFEGLIATVLNCEANDRLLVLIDMLRQSVRVRTPIDDVVPV